MEGGRSYDPYAVPDMVRQFVQYFYRHIRERNVPEIFSMYRYSWAKLTERYFQNNPWPHVDAVAEYVNRDHVFCLLYKVCCGAFANDAIHMHHQEMYFRHLYSITQPTIHARIDSWDNYCALFKVILSDKVNMQLPNEWLWEMLDEFIYQFQSFCQYRGKLTMRTAEEIALLKKHVGVWEVQEVLTILKALVDQSGIVALLNAEGGVMRLYEADGIVDKQRSNVLHLLGYFALVGQVTVHTLLGDYDTALRVMHPLHPFKRKGMLTARITMANITFFYYAGFCYLSLGRYIDAAKLYNYILAFIARVKQLHQGQRVYDIILKKTEQMYRLLAIAVVQAPLAQKHLDDNVAVALREKCGEAMGKMARGDTASYDDAFSYACPKFVTAAPPDYDSLPLVDVNQNCYREQLKAFLGRMEEQRELPNLEQYLKLYSSITLSKLCKLMGADDGEVERQLALLKKLAQCVTWSRGEPTDGAPQPCSDIEVTIRGGPGPSTVIEVRDAKPQRKQTDLLVNHIAKFQQIVDDLSRPAGRAMPAY